MILSPGILALTGVSVLIAAYSLYAAGAGLYILARWDVGHPSEAQLLRERKTCLLSSILAFLMVVNLLCLALFVALAETLHNLFPGAMCAAGTLNANAYGYASLLVMLAGFVLCVLWLVVNHLEVSSPNLSLFRLKYLLLVPVAIVLALESYLLLNYFLRLNPTLITSCCATIFSEAGKGVGSDLAHLSPGLIQPLFWMALAATLGMGLLSFRADALDRIYAGLSAIMLPLGLAAVISFISVRIYQLPNHHCPFCLLQARYGYAGYPLYVGLLLGSSLGMGTGLVHRFGRHDTKAAGIAFRIGSRLKCWSLAGYALFGATASRPLLYSDFKL